MPFVKGMKRHPNAGRKTGASKNKKTLLKLEDALLNRSISPADQLLNEIALMTDPKDRFNGWLKLLEYCEPKKRPVEVSEGEAQADVNPYEHLSDEALLRLVEEDDAG